jgi:hypothetical protein
MLVDSGGADVKGSLGGCSVVGSDFDETEINWVVVLAG